MTNRHIYPRGFELHTESDVDTVKRNSGDSEVEFLYRIFINREESYNSWEFRTKVFFLAKRLMGRNLSSWLHRHVKSGYLHHNTRAFIADTFRFITTGVRHVSTRNWLDLLETTPRVLPTSISTSALQLPVELASDSELFLSRWVAHEGGFEDLLTSLLIMYGPGLPSTKGTIGVDYVSPKNPKLQALTAAIVRNVTRGEEHA